MIKGLHLPESDQIPHQCLECDKLVRSRPIKQCWICRDLEFEEEILCGLNRAVQTGANFICHAFRPRLKLVSSNDAGPSASPPSIFPHSRQIAIQTITASDKFKYQKALALQKLNRDPDEIFSSIKHHLAWNVRHRKPLFDRGADYFDQICDIFLEAGLLVGGTAHLLWLAPDHIHLYVESDGAKSLETITQILKRYSNKNILKIFSELKKEMRSRSTIWDKAYYCETLG